MCEDQWLSQFWSIGAAFRVVHAVDECHTSEAAAEAEPGDEVICRLQKSKTHRRRLYDNRGNV